MRQRWTLKPTSMTSEVFFFTAPWCDPCRQAAPIFSEVAVELKVTSSIVDVDLTPDLADRFGVKRLPTIVVARDGELVSIVEGSRPKAELREFLRASLDQGVSRNGKSVAD